MATEQEIEIEDLRAALTEAHGKLFEAGKFAGRQEIEIEELRMALIEIKQWTEAYPVTVFLPVSDDDLKVAAMVLKAAGISMDAIHASWARHILQGVGDICDKALKLPATP